MSLTAVRFTIIDKGTVDFILSESLFIEWHVRFTMVLLNHLLDQEYIRYPYFTIKTLIYFKRGSHVNVNSAHLHQPTSESMKENNRIQHLFR